MDLARKERRRDRDYVLSLYDWQDAHMAYASACHTRRQTIRLRELGLY